MKNKISILLLLMILLSSISLVYVTADNDDEKDKDRSDDKTDREDRSEDKGKSEEKRKELEEKREVKVEVKDDEVKIKSEVKTGENKDKIEFKLTQKDAIEIEMRYKSKADENKTDIRFRVKIRSIIEFKDTTSDGYQPSEKVSEYDLKKAEYKPILHTTETINGSETHVFTLSTTNDILTVIMRITGSLTQTQNFTMTPRAMKFDVVINNFEYTASDTSLALETRIKTKYKTETREQSEDEAAGLEDKEKEVVVGDGGFFSWAEQADADGNMIDVIASKVEKVDASESDDDLDEGEGEERMWFSFITKNANKIFWDPKIGITTASDLNLNSLNFNFSVFFISIFLLAIVPKKLRKSH